ncbi:hypothetical protein HYH03_004997 [Edaphochlamys debaryana]|uniref:B9 domain-containing protein 2 n=1 Tax=Edaphochlamys debaryana TaxID=47281 RepID=A0A836C2N4_9CHLO|nr:hypothetical protein HYH03_004997 [Edaphochlamys debaryana]|eukprot:KAG2496992.1 hypothetical protein HYH03_004997 [Edaphochlamys debaryana]
MAQRRPSGDLASMLPQPSAKFQGEAQPLGAGPSLQEMPSFAPAAAGTASPGPPPEGKEIVERREARRERRRLAQASPGEGRNQKPSVTIAGAEQSDASLTSPTKSRVSAAGVDSETEKGAGAESTDGASPTPRARRRMSSASRDGSEHGSEAGSPTRRISRAGSRTDVSHDSYDSISQQARSSRRGSGFKKGASKKKMAPEKTSFAELHIVGEIVGASGFSQKMLFCRWQLLYEPSKSWQVLQGLQQGATHACCSGVAEEDRIVWEHPIDIHMQTQSLQGWPALLLMVYARDEGTGRDSFVSYGLINLPSASGCHALSCQTWFAVEADKARNRSFFAWYTGLIPRLEDETFITDLRKREDAGAFIATVGAGEVFLRLNILTRHLDHVMHQGGESLAAALERLTTDILRKSTQMANKAAAIEEKEAASGEPLTEGQKLVRAGRDERLGSARQAIEARRRGEGASPLPSETSRTSLGDRSSFKGFSAGGARSSRVDDGGSEASYTEGGFRRPKDRYADRLARREREKLEKEAEEKAEREAKEAEEKAKAEQEAADKAAAGGGSSTGSKGPSRAGSKPPSRAASVSGAAAASPAPPAAAAGAGGGGGSRAPSRRASGTGEASGRKAPAAAAAADDGMEEMDVEEAEALPGDDGGRAAAREARRAAAAQRSAF